MKSHEGMHLPTGANADVAITADAHVRSRYLGCLLGLAVGDAIGTTVEFCPPGTFEPLTDMVGGGPFGLSPGEWTDDTSMALCLGHSLVHCRGFDARNQMNRYCNWWRYGYLSLTGECFDIGNTVRAALEQYEETDNPFSGSTSATSAGNGAIMRLAPIPMFYAGNAEETDFFAGESARTTHGAAEAIDGARLFGSQLRVALLGTGKEEILVWPRAAYASPRIAAIADGRYRQKALAEIRGSGYIVESLEAALYCFDRTDNYSDAVLMAANLGDDADTTAAICGQLAGAHYGVESIPQQWRERIALRDGIESLALRLLDCAIKRSEG